MIGVVKASWILLLGGVPGLAAGVSVERRAEALDGLIAPGAVVETLATGFQWAEGPVWDAAGGRLLFSDVPRNTVYQWPAGDPAAPEAPGASVFMRPAGFTGVADGGREPGSNGLAFDAAGRLLCCEHGDRRVSLLTAGGGKLTLADQFEGKRLNSPNDLAVHSSGAVYFTDPTYGLPQGDRDPRRELPFCGVFRVTPQRAVTLLVRDLERPNGIAFSPDEKTLYVAQSHPPMPVIMAYPVKPDGTLGTGRVFFDAKPLAGEGPGLPDGLKVARSGHLFATGPGGVLVIDPRGKLLGRVVTGRATANVALGGADGRQLFITAGDRLLRVPLAAGVTKRG